MDPISKKEKDLLDKLLQKNKSVPTLIKRMKISIWLCIGAWLVIPIISCVAFINEGPPKIYHILMIASMLCISVAIYVRCKNVLRIIKQYSP